MFFEVKDYDIWVALIGVVTLAVTILPRLLERRLLSFPIIYIAFGTLFFAAPVGLPAPHPLQYGTIAERLAELGVIISLMGVGLKINQPFSWRAWGPTWRLLAVTMPLTIAGAAILGWWAVGLAPATAMLLGAVLAPTDPVLASDVQTGAPGQTEREDEVRFALTTEAGLNDGLAFPFTHAAVAMVVAGAAPANWFAEWFGVAVVYKIAVGTAVGLGVGRLVAHLVFSLEAGRSPLARTTEGLIAVASTLAVYGIAEILQGYGFVAVFVAALAIRDYERDHEYHHTLHEFSEQAERFVLAVILVLLGGAIAAGVLAPLTWPMVGVGLAMVFIVRPLFGLAGFIRWRGRGMRERLIIGFFGIRGVGSIYYLAFALNAADFPQAEELWALVAFVILVSVVVHGVAAGPVMRGWDRWQRRHGEDVPARGMVSLDPASPELP